MKSKILLSTFLLLSVTIYCQTIILDEQFDDWNSGIALVHQDVSNDNIGSSYDFLHLGISSTKDYLFVEFEVDRLLNLQNTNDIRLYFDTDNDPNTGYKTKGIGADLEYWFGERKGKFTTNGVTYTIGHEDIGFMVLPTVSSKRFELVIDRTKVFGGESIIPNETISVVLLNNRSNGDQIPNVNGGVLYDMNNVQTDIPNYSFKKPSNTDFRILSYNVLKDDMFKDNKKEAYEHIFQTIQPDIIGFEEIYNHSAKETKEKVQEFLGENNTQWYYLSSYPDIICVSKYPILKKQSLNGNAAFWIKKDDKDIVFIVAHLPCCGNDDGRQSEIDNIMSFVRDIKDGSSLWDLDDQVPIIIVGDMNLVGDVQQQISFITGDIYNEGTFGQDFNPDWDNTNFEDALPITTGMPSTITWYDEGSSYNPGRLDYIIYSGSVLEKLNSYCLFSPNLPQDTLAKYQLDSDDTVWASDHIPVVADFRFKNSTSIEPSGLQLSVIVKPNPISEILNVDINVEKSMDCSISIVNMNGQEVYQVDKNLLKGNNVIDIDVSRYTKGIYNLVIVESSQNGALVEKIVIIK